jgi:hypothetical protein
MAVSAETDFRDLPGSNIALPKNRISSSASLGHCGCDRHHL